MTEKIIKVLNESVTSFLKQANNKIKFVYEI